jgi:hypothetical protein
MGFFCVFMYAKLALERLRTVVAEPKREILWEHPSGAKYNGFVVGPTAILAAGFYRRVCGQSTMVACRR